MKRPLFAAAVLLVTVTWVKLWAGGYDPPTEIDSDSAVRSNQELCVSGRICQKEPTKIWLDSIIIWDSEESFLQNQISGSEQAIKEKLNEKIICDLPDNSPCLSMGETVVVTGKFSLFSKATNPGEFDSFRYYRSLRVAGQLKKVRLLGRNGSPSFLRELAWRTGQRAGQRINNMVSGENAGVLCALLLGDKARLDASIKKLYQHNGILHILSISSLHVTMIGVTLYRLLRKAGMPVISAALLASGALLFYGAVTGFGVSVCRAVGMFILRMLAEMVGMTYDMPTALGILAAGMVLANPFYLQNSGFLLSFGAVLGICFVYPALAGEEKPVHARYYGEKWYFLRVRETIQGLGKSFLSSLAISLTTLPIQLTFFFEVPVWTVCINLLILPLMKPLLGLGLLCLIPGLGFLACFCQGILWLFEEVCLGFEKIPFHTWNPGCPAPWQVCLYYGLLICCCLGRRIETKGKRVLFKLFCIAAALFILGGAWKETDRIISLDVGQGECTLIQTCEGKAYLFDCGSSTRTKVGEKVLLPCLKYYGINRLECVFVSHPDTDHTSGVKELLGIAGEQGISIGALVLPGPMSRERGTMFEELLSLANSGGAGAIPVFFVTTGDKIGPFLCLHPGESYRPEGTNDMSLCLLGNVAGAGILLTGDVEGQGEEALRENMENLGLSGLTFLKCAHHGSRNSSTLSFLQQVSPEIVVISCGKNNTYGHPHGETLRRLEQVNCAIYRTDKQGAVAMEIRRKRIIIK